MAELSSVLYVEDESRSRKVMKMLLEGRMGIPHVTIFENSTDFLDRVLALEPRPEVVFLDIHVPPLDGFETLKILRATPEFQDTPIIALTASVMNEEVEQLQGAGFDGCLGKPIDVDSFPLLLADIMNGETIWHIAS